MKKSFIRNPQAQVSEKEASIVEEIASPIKLDAFMIILLLFIFLPVIYVLIVQTPGSWMPKNLAKLPEIKSAETPAIQVAPSNEYASLDSAIIKASNYPSFDNYFQLSFKFYQAGKFKESITAAQKAIEFNPRSAEAYNNMCSAYNELKDFKNAKEACDNALKIKPEFQLAKNNLEWAEKNLKSK